jgi:hypothetical protein
MISTGTNQSGQTSATGFMEHRRDVRGGDLWTAIPALPRELSTSGELWRRRPSDTEKVKAVRNFPRFATTGEELTEMTPAEWDKKHRDCKTTRAIEGTATHARIGYVMQ